MRILVLHILLILSLASFCTAPQKKKPEKKSEPAETSKSIFSQPEKSQTRTGKLLPDDFKSMDEDDYLDIPTFLRKNKEG